MSANTKRAMKRPPRAIEIRFVPRPAGHSYDATLRWLTAEGKRLRRQQRRKATKS